MALKLNVFTTILTGIMIVSISLQGGWELGNKLVKHATKFLSRRVLEREAYVFNLNNSLHIY